MSPDRTPEGHKSINHFATLIIMYCSIFFEVTANTGTFSGNDNTHEQRLSHFLSCYYSTASVHSVH